jgi:predicted Zn-dependent peptidase
VLDRWLNHRSPSRLERALVTDSTDCLAANAGLDLRRGAGIFYVAVAVRPGADSAQVERFVTGTVESLAGQGVDDTSARGAVRQSEVETLFGWQNTEGFAHALGSSAAVDGDVAAAANRVARIRQLTAADLRDVASRIFRAQNRTVVWMVPAPPAGSAPTGKAPPARSRRAPTTAPRAKGGR